MKACNVVNLLVVVRCVTLTSNVYGQASNAMPMASSPAVSSGRHASGQATGSRCTQGVI
jgi:hyperosmotically inducible protein